MLFPGWHLFEVSAFSNRSQPTTLLTFCPLTANPLSPCTHMFTRNIAGTTEGAHTPAHGHERAHLERTNACTDLYSASHPFAQATCPHPRTGTWPPACDHTAAACPHPCTQMQDPSQSAAAIQQQQQILLAQMMGGTGRTLPLPYLTTQVRVCSARCTCRPWLGNWLPPRVDCIEHATPPLCVGL